MKKNALKKEIDVNSARCNQCVRFFIGFLRIFTRVLFNQSVHTFFNSFIGWLGAGCVIHFVCVLISPFLTIFTFILSFIRSFIHSLIGCRSYTYFYVIIQSIFTPIPLLPPRVHYIQVVYVPLCNHSVHFYPPPFLPPPLPPCIYWMRDA